MMKFMMKTVGYIRVSTDEQDLSRQRHLLLEYAQQQRLIIHQFIEVEVSSRKTPKELLNFVARPQIALQPDINRYGEKDKQN
jgi:DNA invertase Pin-like site-specific DNA recombinase